MNFKQIFAILIVSNACFANDIIFTEKTIEIFNVKYEDIDNINNKIFTGYIPAQKEVTTNSLKNSPNVFEEENTFVYVKNLHHNRIQAHNELLRILKTNLQEIDFITEQKKKSIEYLLEILNIKERAKNEK